MFPGGPAAHELRFWVTRGILDPTLLDAYGGATMTVSQDLLEILRCPYCVSGDTRKPGDDPGRLELVRDGEWLICQEPDCGRKYPIREDIPVMLIEEGDKWVSTQVGDLPEPGALV